jgi:hypothetical protein
MKKWLIPIGIIIVLVVSLEITTRKMYSYEQKWKTAAANEKAYQMELSGEKKISAAYEMTIDQMKYGQDSILRALEETRKQLKIKDKNLQSVQYVYSNFYKTDTLNFRDTIFKEPSLAIDTMVGDEWFNARLFLKYPSRVILNPSFKSEKQIFVSTKRETVNPPKKFFLFRWFQKRHTVLSVDVVERNPYVQEESSKFIKVIR